MMTPRTPEEIRAMREGGRKIWQVLQRLLDESQVGVTLNTIEEHAQAYIKEAGGVPSFMTVKGYEWATCLCINDQVVHGIPNAYALREGDVFTIDIGMVYEGLHTDTAWTKIIGTPEKTEEERQKERFLEVGKATLVKAQKVAIAGNRVGHISKVIEDEITGAGYAVVKSLTGHGVGKKLHEEPLIPGYPDKPIERTPLLVSGMTIAIEIIYAMGSGEIVYASRDGWTLSSEDGSLTAVFEQTGVIGEHEMTVLTGS